jgi:hypothetical protein
MLIAQPWRNSETGEISMIASPTYPQDVNPTAANSYVPRNAVQSPCFTSTTRQKEIERLLKFGRDSNWPVSISVAASLDGLNSATVTYAAEWTDCDSTKEWFIAQWRALALNDQLIGLPAMFRDSATWSLELRKEDNALRGILREDGASTPEDAGVLVSCSMVQEPLSNSAVNHQMSLTGH